MVALLGPNGSGKTTLLRTIYGILRTEKGAVYLDEMRLQEMKIEEIARYIGYLPQERAETNLKVLDVVLLGRTTYNRKPSESDVKIALQSIRDVGLTGFENRLFSQLSGGEKQKVLIARIFSQKSDILLLDEPTAHLDISSQIEIMEILREKTREGSSSLIAIHDINLASTFCDKILMVKDGRIAFAGGLDIITEKNIREVFQADVSVRKQSGRPFVVPISRKKPHNNRNKKIHVICGGGSGEEIIRLMSDRGYSLSAGVLNALDSDIDAILGVGDVVTEAPFSPISRDSYIKNLEMIDRSDAVILTNLCVGAGNLLNLQAALKATEKKKLIVIDSTPFKERNFVGDKAEEIYRKLLSRAFVVKSEEDVPKFLSKLVQM
jgi:iron complex transport system ATP-binding protein